jgi:hypothetical protein
MNAWLKLSVVGLATLAVACGDDAAGTGGAGQGGSGGSPNPTVTSSASSTTTSSSDGGGGSGEGGDGGGGEPGSCVALDDCADDEFCEFRDGLCGSGDPGVCTPRPEVCTDGWLVCLCDGQVLEHGQCHGWSGFDEDASGGCRLTEDQFACGDQVCELTRGQTWCQITPDDTGGAAYASCGFGDQATCDPATCDCLADVVASCSGTCVDGEDGFPTVTCPGG